MRRVFVAVVAILLGVALAEGFASCALLSSDLLTGAQRPLAERQHTRYDAELGWVNVPGVAVPDLYGPGLGVTIDDRGFRAMATSAITGSIGRVRVLATGDSMTFGYGVGDSDTWPARLAARVPSLDVVNMGQGGYGVDQMVLWYARDGRVLESEVHLFAVVWHDFSRMRADRFQGYGKPLLEMTPGGPVALRVPVPQRAFYLPWLTQNAPILGRLRSVELARRLSSQNSDENLALTTDAAFDLARRAILWVNAQDRAHGGRLAVVWLPLLEDAPARPALDGRRRRFLARLRQAGVVTLDLVGPLRELPPAGVADLFLAAGDVRYPGAEGHYDRDGNAWIAARIDEELRRQPALRGVWPGAP